MFRRGMVTPFVKRWTGRRRKVGGLSLSKRWNSRDQSMYAALTKDLPFEIRDTGSAKGRGCFATRDIEENELILCEDPIACMADADSKELPQCSSTMLSLSPDWFQSAGFDLLKHMNASREEIRKDIVENGPPGLFPENGSHTAYECGGNCPCERKQVFASQKVYETAYEEYHQRLCPQWYKKNGTQEQMDALEAIHVTAEKSSSSNHLSLFLLKILATLEVNTKKVHGIPIQDIFQRLGRVSLSSASEEERIGQDLFDQIHFPFFSVLFPNVRSTWLKDESKLRALTEIVVANSFSIESQAPKFLINSSIDNPSLVFDIDNNHRIGGTALFAIASHFNHTCADDGINVVMAEPAFYGSKTNFVANKNIKKGDELLMCYARGNTQKETQKIIEEQYGFRCIDTCELCTSSSS